jgi:hypothetical protein
VRVWVIEKRGFLGFGNWESVVKVGSFFLIAGNLKKCFLGYGKEEIFGVLKFETDEFMGFTKFKNYSTLKCANGRLSVKF